MLAVINKIHWCVAVCSVNCTIDRHCCSHVAVIDPIGRYYFCLLSLHSTPPLGGHIRNIAMMFGTEKSRLVWLADGENVEDLFICFNRMWQTGRQTDGQTPHDGIGRAYTQHCAAITAKVSSRSPLWQVQLLSGPSRCSSCAGNLAGARRRSARRSRGTWGRRWWVASPRTTRSDDSSSW